MIKHITYHILSKEQHGSAEIRLNPQSLIPNKSHQNFLDKLTKEYTSKTGKAFGVFDQDEDIYPMPKLLKDYFVDKDFNKLTERMMTVLYSKIEKQPLATGGKVFIAHYEEQGRDYIQIAILADRIGFTAQDWQMEESEMLDVEHLKYAGRIDLTGWQNLETRYISFLKGQGEVSVYFKEFLACNDALFAKKETNKLIYLLEEFVKEQKLNFDEGSHFLNEAQGYLTEIHKKNELLIVETFANKIWPQQPQLLKDKLSNADTGISEGFVPHRLALKALSTYEEKTKTWSLSFVRDAIVNGDITENDGKIIINNPTEKLLKAFNFE